MEIPNVPLPAHDTIKMGIERKKRVLRRHCGFLMYNLVGDYANIMRYQRMLKSEAVFHVCLVVAPPGCSSTLL